MDLVTMDLVSFLQLLLSGLLLGGVYAMVAAGLALCFGVLGLLNLAHGSFLVLAAYAYQTFQRAQSKRHKLAKEEVLGERES